MLCPYCDQPVTTRVCPHCGAVQTVVPEVPVPAPAVRQIGLPALGKYRCNDGYIELSQTGLTLLLYGAFSNTTRQFSYAQLQAVTYRAPTCSTRGYLRLHDAQSGQYGHTLRFTEAESAPFYAIYQALQQIVSCNLESSAPQLCFAQARSAPAPMDAVRALNICTHCSRGELRTVRRGYSWGLGLLGFFLLPVFGLLLGFIGADKTHRECAHCGKRF